MRTGLDAVNQLEDIPHQMNIEDAERPEDGEVAMRLTNRYIGIGARAARCDVRTNMMNMIWDTGLRITSAEDLLGLPIIGDDDSDAL